MLGDRSGNDKEELANTGKTEVGWAVTGAGNLGLAEDGACKDSWDRINSASLSLYISKVSFASCTYHRCV